MMGASLRVFGQPSPFSLLLTPCILREETVTPLDKDSGQAWHFTNLLLGQESACPQSLALAMAPMQVLD